MEETISTRQLALRTIENIGSEPKYDEAGRIQFENNFVYLQKNVRLWEKEKCWGHWPEIL